MSQALDFSSIDTVLPQLSALSATGTENGRAATTSLFPSQSQTEGTAIIGIKIDKMVILAAQDLANGVPAIQLEWVTDSIFIAQSGQATHSSQIIQTVRKICLVTPPSSFEEVVSLVVNESNEKLGTVVDDTDVYSFVVGGRLHREHDCQLFLVNRDYNQNPPLYVSKSGDLLIAPISRGKKFFSDDVKTKLLQADKDRNRASLSQIVKDFFTDSCVNHGSSKGRLTMVTIDERGFHVLESAEYGYRNIAYKESKFNGFCPVGYQTLWL